MILFLILLATPLIEIALFIQVGDAIGLWPTLGIVIATALIGSYALRQQGFATLARLRSLESPDKAPTVLLEGVLLMAAGLLLLTPGVLTDAIGFALLVPPIRRFAAQHIAARAITIVTGSAGAPGGGPAPGGAGSGGMGSGGPGQRPGDGPSGAGRRADSGPGSSSAGGSRTGPGHAAHSPFRKRGRVVEAEEAVVLDDENQDRRGR